MDKPQLCPKGLELIELYTQMAEQGYERTDNTSVENAFSDFELKAYRTHLKELFVQSGIKTTLDYGCGGSNWELRGFDDESNQSAKEYFDLEQAWHYEPARGLDERKAVDCVVSFDVLEHVFIADVPSVLRDMFSYANQLLLLNVACYPAAAKLPNGENAHITVRPPQWWKGMIDCLSPEYPHVSVFLIYSTGWRQSQNYKLWSGDRWLNSDTFVVEI